MNHPILSDDKILGVTLLLLLGIAAISCGSGIMSQDLSIEEAETALVGSWGRTHEFAFTTYTTVLAFTEDGAYKYSNRDGIVNNAPPRKLGDYSVSGNGITVVATDSLGVAEIPARVTTLTFGISDGGRKLTIGGFDLSFWDGVYSRR